MEIFHTLGLARDSKDPKGVEVPLTPGFLSAVKAGRFDMPPASSGS